MPSARALELHSLNINGEIDTWDNWKIVSIKKPIFNEPDLITDYVSVPGRNGQLDMTEALTGYPVYDNRRGTLQFFVYDTSMPALTKLNIIRNYLHGKRHKIILNDEPEYYYDGRLMLHESHPTTEGEYAVFELEYNLEPYKYELNSSLGNWLWDPFNFEMGVIRETNEIEINGSKSIKLYGSRMPSVPRFIVDGNFTLIFGENSYVLSTGTIVIPTISLVDGEYELTFNGTGTITIDFRVGCL